MAQPTLAECSRLVMELALNFAQNLGVLSLVSCSFVVFFSVFHERSPGRNSQVPFLEEPADNRDNDKTSFDKEITAENQERVLQKSIGNSLKQYTENQ